MDDTSQWITEATAETFEAEVVNRSVERPVVIDFWAPWCGPCRQLTPMLEKLAREYAGKFQLVKINVDESPEIAGAFAVESIPYVVAIHQGRPVDQFRGLLPESEIRNWLGNLVPSPSDELVQRGRELERADPAGAEACYRDALRLSPGDDAIRIHLARVILAQERDEEARKIIDDLEQRGWLEPEAETIKSQLDLRAGAEEAGGVSEARQAAEANPGDLALQLQLAEALAAARKHQEALRICLEIIEKDKSGVGLEAKETMVRIFDVLGPASELTGEYRRKLATAWY